jgi:deoxycytidylate deaminase
MFSGLTEPYPSSTPTEAQRVDALMTRGNQAREFAEKGEVLALCAINDIHGRRSEPNAIIPKTAFVLRQLKHPDEVYRLRKVYGDGFHLFGLYCPRDDRERHLRLQYGMSDEEIKGLIERDEEEKNRFGQHVRDTFHMADVFFRIAADGGGIEDDVERWVDLMFGLSIHGPTKEEFGMFQAHGAAFRSAQLSRQVGAAILTERGDVIAVGTNEVPRAGGGPYWERDRYDKRDHRLGEDSNDVFKRKILIEALSATDPAWNERNPQDQEKRLSDFQVKLKGSRLTNLTEFIRAVHAEMEAILSAARNGISTRRTTLYCTTFPCHNCAKHIIDAGIKKVVYIEPYAKSLSSTLHEDAISLEKPSPNKITFTPFVGIAPRKYVPVFSMKTQEGEEIERKDSTGKLQDKMEPKLRLKMSHFSALDHESNAAQELLQLM